MRVVVAYAAPEAEAIVVVTLADGARLSDAVAGSRILERLGLAAARLAYAIYGERAAPDTKLRDGDRVEVLRPLISDPKDARRERAALHSPPGPVPTPGRGRPAGG